MTKSKIKVIITGATGMVGEGVLHEALQDYRVESVLIVNRRPSGISHPKLKEIIFSNFFDIQLIRDQLRGYDATYFCLGVTSLGKNEEQYFKLTYILTLNFAKTVAEINPNHCFCYVSGVGTDSTEKGKIMWARVKGKTENALFKLPFGSVFNFRPGFIKPTPGLKNTYKMYKALGFIFYPLKWVAPNSFCTLAEIGKAMINVTIQGFPKHTLGIREMKEAARLN